MEESKFSRIIPLVNDFDEIKNAKVAIVGLGGVGGMAAITLARCGISHFILCDFDKESKPNDWAVETAKAFQQANTLDYKVLNEILIERYKLLDSKFQAKLKKHREKQYFLASSDGFNFVTKDYAAAQMNVL